MADDKDKKGDGEESGKKGGGLMPVIFVAIGAALGGAGTVVMSPSPTDEEAHHVRQEFLVAHPDSIELQFHPRPSSPGGPTRLARCIFKFEYRTSAYDPTGHGDSAGGGHGAPGGGGGKKGPQLSAEEKAFLEGMKLHWTPMEAAVLHLLSDYTESELIDNSRRDEITRRLQDLMTRVLFPSGEAVVERVYILQMLIQK